VAELPQCILVFVNCIRLTVNAGLYSTLYPTGARGSTGTLGSTGPPVSSTLVVPVIPTPPPLPQAPSIAIKGHDIIIIAG